MAEVEGARVQKVLRANDLEEMVRKEFGRMEASLLDGAWKYNVPGKPIIKSFFAEAKIDASHVKSTYIRIAVKRPDNPFQDIIDIFDDFRKM